MDLAAREWEQTDGVTQYLAKRLGMGLLTVFLVSVSVFALIRLVPGDAASRLAGDQATPQDIDRARRLLGLDKPLHIQYIGWLGRIVSNTERSIATRDLVVAEIARRAPNTALLALCAMGIATVLAIPLGITAALKATSFIDKLIGAISAVSISTPAYVVAFLAIYVFVLRLGLLPAGGTGSINHLVLPVAILAFTHIGTIARTTRSSVFEALSQDFVRTASAKGLSPFRIIYGHILRFSLVPIVAVIGVDLGTLLAGAAVTETVFSWPGLGRLMVESVRARDFPLLQTLVMLFSIVFVVVNLLIDVSYTLLDPRVRYA